MVRPSADSSGGPDRELFLARLTEPRVRQLLEPGDVDLLVPLGALEQHGPHLPLGTDTAITMALALRVARQVSGLLIAPCLPVGRSDHHLSFAGTASIPADVAAGYIRSVALTLLGHGFRHAYIVSGHAGNIPAMKAALRGLAPEVEGRIAAFVDWPAQRDAMHQWAETSLGLSREDVGSHAGHFETSIMLDIEPDLVDMSSAPRGFIGPVDEASRLMAAKGMAAVSEVGVLGDARGATAEAGSGYLDVLVDSVVYFIAKHREDHPHR